MRILVNQETTRTQRMLCHRAEHVWLLALALVLTGCEDAPTDQDRPATPNTVDGRALGGDVELEDDGFDSETHDGGQTDAGAACDFALPAVQRPAALCPDAPKKSSLGPITELVGSNGLPSTIDLKHFARIAPLSPGHVAVGRVGSVLAVEPWSRVALWSKSLDTGQFDGVPFRLHSGGGERLVASLAWHAHVLNQCGEQVATTKSLGADAHSLVHTVPVAKAKLLSRGWYSLRLVTLASLAVARVDSPKFNKAIAPACTWSTGRVTDGEDRNVRYLSVAANGGSTWLLADAEMCGEQQANFRVCRLSTSGVFGSSACTVLPMPVAATPAEVPEVIAAHGDGWIVASRQLGLPGPDKPPPKGISFHRWLGTPGSPVSVSRCQDLLPAAVYTPLVMQSRTDGTGWLVGQYQVRHPKPHPIGTFVVRFDTLGRCASVVHLPPGENPGVHIGAVVLIARGAWLGGSSKLLQVDDWGHGSCAAAGKCANLSFAECADSDPCTRDYCVPASGCVHTTWPDGTTCGVGKVCKAGACGES